MQTETTIKADLTGVPETLLIPLYYRAKESIRESGILSDLFAEDWVNQIEYDFEKFDDNRYSEVGVAVRTEILDGIALRFLEKHPRGTVVNLGAGLCTRFLRLANSFVNWFELDVPEAIELRKGFITPSHRYKYIAKSAFDYTWLDDVAKAIAEDDGKILIITEGTLMYFDKREVKELFHQIRIRFPGAEVATDTIPPLLVKYQSKHKLLSKTDAEFKWALGNIRELEDWGIGIDVIEEYPYINCHPKRWGIIAYLRFIPYFKRMSRFIHFRFEG